MLRGLLRGYASGSASHELHHMELTSYLRGFQQTFQPSIYLCVYPCVHTYIYIYTYRERERHVWFSGLNQLPRARVWLSQAQVTAGGWFKPKLWCHGGMGKDVLFSRLCRDVKYLTHAFKMCQGLEVEGLRYETGVIRVWFGYDSRSTIQHTVSDLDRSYNGQSAPEAGRCKRYRLPQWSYSGQSAPKLSPTYLCCIGQPDCGDGGRDGAKGA